MSLQKYFRDFNKTIKMDYDVKSELASKRDILLKKLRDSNELPGFTELNQGSYIMYTGVEPLDKEYDIDVGLRFNVNQTTLIISKKPGNTGISRDIRTEFTTDLLLSD